MSTAAGSLAQDLLLAFRDQQLSDITVMAFGQTFHLHRLILLRCGYFRSLILGQGDWIEKSRQAITIQFDDPYVTLQSFQRIIHWLYGIDFHYSEGCAPLTFRATPTGVQGTGQGVKGTPSLDQSTSSQYYTHSAAEVGRRGLGLRQGGGNAVEHTVDSERSSVNGTGTVSFHHYENIMMDPSDKVDELLISMYAAASYLNITALTEEICSDIAHRIRDSRGLIHYMEYAWKLNNGRAWDIILAHCFYQFFWYTYKSSVLQEMLVSQDMPIAGLIKTLVSESLWVPNEYERYQLVKGIMLRRLNIETEKLMNWIYEYHDQDWFMVLKELDDNGTWSYDLSSDTFLSNLQDWESTSTTEYEDAVDSDHEWVTTTKEMRRRSSQISTAKLNIEDERNTTPTAGHSSVMGDRDRDHDTVDPEEVANTTVEEPMAPEKKTTPQSPTLGTPISSPSLSALSITSDTLPRHQVRDLLILMYILHHSIHYTHMSFEHLHQILSDGLVLPARTKDAFWRQHLLRRIACSTSPTLPYLTAPSAPLHGRYHGADPASRERRTPQASAASRAKMSGSTPASPVPVSAPINSHGLLPIRFSTSLYISRRDLMTDGKHFTSSTFYGGSWWSIQVGNTLNSDGQMGVFLSSAPVPRVVPNTGARAPGRSSRSGATGILAALRGDQQTTSTAGQQHRRPVTVPAQQSGTTENGGGSGDCSSVYSRQRELACSYRIYMTTNVIEPPQYFAATAAGRLEEIRGSEYISHHPYNGSTKDMLGSGGINGAASAASTPEISSANTFPRPSQKIAAEDEMIGEDTFKLNEGWGYRYRRYLTRVARQVRDQPPKSSQGQSSFHPQENSHGSMPSAVGGPGQGGGHPLQQQPPQPALVQQPQLQNQLHHGQPANIGQQPLAQPHQPGPPQQQQNFAHLAAFGQQQPVLAAQNNAQPVNVNANANANANPNVVQGQATQAQQHPGIREQQTASSSNSQQGPGSEESEDDGLWIHFVVKVGWSDRQRNEEKAAN
ncbi:hypothetical protein BGZ58_008359 [Dissophora ornata]|nr:hypothetical protein BGZ58_008359 [Dissophora ornata]